MDMTAQRQETTKNKLIPLTITGQTSDGSGIARHDGLAVFVQGAMPGDIIVGRVLKVNKTIAYAKIEELVTPSPDRIQPDCPVFAQCGGCALRHMRYEAELAFKQERVESALARIGGIMAAVDPVAGAADQMRYRNKAQFPVRLQEGRAKIGFFAPHSHRVIECDDCLLHPAEFSAVIRIFRAYMDKHQIPAYDEQTHTGLLRGIYLRKAFATGELMVCAVINGKQLPKAQALIEALKTVPGFITLVLNINKQPGNTLLGRRCQTLHGPGVITDALCGLRFQLSPLSFYQVNHDQTERLYAIAGEYAQPAGAALLDLYCGTGTIGLSMAQEAREVIGVEMIPGAVEDAGRNAALNGIGNARFLCADATEAAKRLAGEGIVPDVVMLDPPRKGCDAALLRLIAGQINPKRVLYVSCDPATLARDLKLLAQLGYETKRVTPVDFFPRTLHVECVALLEPVER